jgi:hypothetical protein
MDSLPQRLSIQVKEDLAAALEENQMAWSKSVVKW